MLTSGGGTLATLAIKISVLLLCSPHCGNEKVDARLATS